MTMAILFGAFLLCLILTVPIGISLGVASLAAIAHSTSINSTYFAQRLTAAADSFPLMAIPFFILAGNLMGRGGVSRRLLNLAHIFFGRYTGGLALVTVAACIFFGAISGAATATVAAVGCVMVPQMLARGYGKPFCSALIASAGGIGAIIPPSVSMVVFCVATNQSITELFLGGVFPGVIIGIGLMVYSYFYSKRKGGGGDPRRYSAAEVWEVFWDAKWAIVVPIIILGGIYGGVFTPTEAAAVAVVYGFVVGVFIYKDIKISEIPGELLSAGVITASVLVIIGTSNGFGSIMTLERIPSKVAAFIISISDNKIVILLLLNAFLLFVGTFMDSLAAIIILAPILTPVATRVGVDPIHFGLIMCTNFTVGYITPPVGANLFVACGITGISFADLCRVITPFVITMTVTVLILTFCPQFTLFLPRYFMRGMGFFEALTF